MLVLHHVRELEPVFAELARVVGPTGRGVILDMVEHRRSDYRQSMGHQHLGFSVERVRELARGADAHGTCGVGVGETVGDSLAFPDQAIRAAALWAGHPMFGRDARRKLVNRLRLVQARKLRDLEGELEALEDSPAVAAEREILEDPGLPERWLEALAPLWHDSRAAIMERLRAQFTGAC